MFYRSRRTL